MLSGQRGDRAPNADLEARGRTTSPERFAVRERRRGGRKNENNFILRKVDVYLWFFLRQCIGRVGIQVFTLMRGTSGAKF